MIDHSQRYVRYLRDKKVIFVGPARTLIGSGQGEFIDSFDVVIRTNGSFPIKEENKKDYGTKCHSLYWNMLYARSTKFRPDYFQRLGLQFLNLKQDMKKLMSRHKSALFIREFYKDMFMAQREIGAAPLMGSYIVWEVSRCNPKQLYLTGMDCYSSEDQENHYLDDYLPPRANLTRLEDIRKKGHNQPQQNLYLKKMYNAGKIEIDNHIKKALNL